MSLLDWIVMGSYLLAMLLLAWRIGRRQQSRRDYYLGGNRMGPLPLATSTIATQCSTNSLLGAPAFVGFVAGGGMLWLQYEVAVPLAMLALMGLFGPIRASGHLSVYAFLEERLARFHFVGSYRRADEMIGGISRELGIPDAVDHRNVTPARKLSAGDLPREMRSRIEADNALDMALYERWGDRGWQGAPDTAAPALSSADHGRYLAGDAVSGVLKKLIA